jgi:hypothetical protein
VKVGPKVLQRTAGTDSQSCLHVPVELRMVIEGLRGTLTITACVDPICIQVTGSPQMLYRFGTGADVFRQSDEYPGCGSLQEQMQRNCT